MRNYIRAGRYDDEIEYYQDGYGPTYIQLSDNHTIWKLEPNDVEISRENEEFADYYYWDLVNSACKQFEQKSGVEVYLLGRSSRHVCVEDNAQNRRRYRSLCNLQQKLEKWVVTTFNNGLKDELDYLDDSQ